MTESQVKLPKNISKMNCRLRIILLVSLVLILCGTIHLVLIRPEPETKIGLSGKIKISVYYEALCPDSKYFITHQLLPLYNKLSEYIHLDLVPYGKATTIESGNSIQFQCQHDEVECHANKIHACVINSVNNPLTELKYVACMITNNVDPDAIAKSCGQELDIEATPILNCANGKEGSLLLKAHGVKTDNLDPIVHFIPTIEINDSQYLVSQSLILKNLEKAVCGLFKTKPTKCDY